MDKLKPKYKLVLVDWVDSTRWNHWTDHESLEKEPEDLRCVSVGFLTAENKEFIRLAAHLSQKQGAGTMSIPRVAITSIKEIKGIR